MPDLDSESPLSATDRHNKDADVAENRSLLLHSSASLDECPHIIWFDDNDREPILFAGHGARAAALKTWDLISVSWNAHLFVCIASNSRDAKTPCAEITESRTDDMAMLIKQLIHALNKASPGNKTAARALDYLQRKNLIGSPLR